MLWPHVKGRDFSEWARERLLESLRAEMPAALEAVAGEGAEPPRPAREALSLPPWGETDTEGCRYAWEPNLKGNAGTLTIVSPRDRLALDLVGVEIEEREGGVVVSFADRSQVRRIEEE